MKKLQLTALQLGAQEVLTRDQLRGVSGGNMNMAAARCQVDEECAYDFICVDGYCITPRCSSGSCSIDVPGTSGAAGACETNSRNKCVCRALDHGASSISNECLN
ncbi:hypothetical protein [Chitinophaga nivalis]|uniref:EB domain-containing protein n=1 Tax=Chitinophaga nivalis TaxID=2991709 RepID=A0ABT3IKF4_9BACT|nr:hypothetical protein [Chitinophaga nivalis]MCW3465876.1 hypothetical protein [Chitinophaga nivalis]MCW3484433.1 hypothetical protein [Chitinophaga nivalis]